jgi:nitrate/nitrite transporter NarK
MQVYPSVFWSIPSSMLTGAAAAGGLAMINSVGNLGGWLGPMVYGMVKDATGSTNIGLLCLAAAPVVSAIAILAAGHDPRLERLRVRR